MPRTQSFRLFLTRVFLFDFVGIGMVPIAEMIVFPILYICLLRLGGHPIASAAIALILVEVNLVLFSLAIEEYSSSAANGELITRPPSGPGATFAYFFAQDCFSVPGAGVLSCSAPELFSQNPILRWMGCHIGHGTIVARPTGTR